MNSLIGADDGDKFEHKIWMWVEVLAGRMLIKYADGGSIGCCISGDVELSGSLGVPKISTKPTYIYGLVYVKGELSPFDISGGLSVDGTYDESKSKSGISGNLSFGAELSGSIKIAAGIDDVCSAGVVGTASTTFSMTGTINYSDKKLILYPEASMSKIHLEGSSFNSK